jgi:hypothetical protein
MSVSRMTTRGLLWTTAIVALILGLVFNYQLSVPLFYLVLLTAPHSIIVAFFMFLATRGKNGALKPAEPASPAVQPPTASDDLF